MRERLGKRSRSGRELLENSNVAREGLGLSSLAYETSSPRSGDRSAATRLDRRLTRSGSGLALAGRPMGMAGEEAGGETDLVTDKKPETQTEET